MLYLVKNDNISLQDNPAEGYYKNSVITGKYIECKNNGCSVVDNPTDDGSTIGTLVKDGSVVKLCLDGTKKVEFAASSDNEKNYLISYDASSVFKTVTSNHYGIVKVGINSMTIDTTVTTNKEICADNSLLEVSELNNEGCDSGKTLYSLCTNGICEKICKVASGTNCIDATYYLVSDETTSKPITDNSTGKLFYCATANNACTEINDKGYYINSGTDAYICSGSSVTCKKETINSETQCNDSNIGKLVLVDTNKPAICLSYKISSAVTKNLSENDGNYLLAYITDNIFGVTENNMGIVKIENKSVKLLANTGYTIEKSDNILAKTADDTGTLYTCTAGICSSVTDIKLGYYKNAIDASTYIQCNYDQSNTNIVCKVIGNLASDCTSNTAGAFTQAGVCLGAENKSVNFVNSDDAKKYLIAYSASSIFTSVPQNKYGVVIATTTSLTFEPTYDNEYGVCVEESTMEVKSELSNSSTTCSNDIKYGFCNAGVCYKTCEVTSTDGVNCEAAKYYLVRDSTSSIPVIATNTNGHLYYCNSSGAACTEVSAKGYYVNSDTEAYNCNGTSGQCKIETIADGATCTTESIGKLVKDSNDSTGTAICLNFATQAITAPLSTPGNYLMTYKDSNIFGISGNMGLINIADNSITLNTANGYCAEDTTNSNKLATSSSSSATLHNCSNGLCETVLDTNIKIGYYRNAVSTTTGTSDYIKCSKATGTDKICKIVDISTKSGCEKAGEIIYESNETTYKLCLTNTIPLTLDQSATATSYFLDVSDTTNTDLVFGTKATSYIKVDVSNGNVFLHNKETGIERYQYAETSSNKFLNFADSNIKTAQCTDTSSLQTIPTEFELLNAEENDDTNYYKIISSSSSSP